VWIIRAWQCVSPEVTVKGLKKCFISSAVDWCWFVGEWQWRGWEC